MKKREPRELTKEEARKRFLETVYGIAQYWAKESREIDVTAKCEGVAFSILSLLDGCNGNMPGFLLIPAPHPSDKDYMKDEGEDWFRDYPESAEEYDIGGNCLHELFQGVRREMEEGGKKL
jgi:hypothetical protein